MTKFKPEDRVILKHLSSMRYTIDTITIEGIKLKGVDDFWPEDIFILDEEYMNQQTLKKALGIEDEIPNK